ncbi:hypothetical protein [Sorangium sp. So ce1335]|uniref:hypothetical protein n=1 Tax=Sorangium sp. So ce1335 TaxID=3133335 RepID=UPI003F5E137D
MNEDHDLPGELQNQAGAQGLRWKPMRVVDGLSFHRQLASPRGRDGQRPVFSPRHKVRFPAHVRIAERRALVAARLRETGLEAG